MKEEGRLKEVSKKLKGSLNLSTFQLYNFLTSSLFTIHNSQFIISPYYPTPQLKTHD